MIPETHMWFLLISFSKMKCHCALFCSAGTRWSSVGLWSHTLDDLRGLMHRHVAPRSLRRSRSFFSKKKRTHQADLKLLLHVSCWMSCKISTRTFAWITIEILCEAADDWRWCVWQLLWCHWWRCRHGTGGPGVQIPHQEQAWEGTILMPISHLSSATRRAVLPHT